MSAPGTALVCLVLALAWDVVFRELPNAAHPVAWFGRLAGAARGRLPLAPPLRALLGGALLLALVPLTVGAVVWITRAARVASPWAESALALFWLQASFSCRGLLDAGLAVERALRANDLATARSGLSSLCSRDPSSLNGSELAGAATASLAENLSDSVVAPLFYYVLFGLPGALAFRAVNTLDAMVGYRGRYEWLGKPAARVDDVLGLVPARLSAILLWLAAVPLRLDVARGWRTCMTDARLTPSPNGGFPMAMTAGLLGVCLVKPDTYTLGAAGDPPSVQTLTDARRLVGLAMTITALLAVAALALGDPTGPVWSCIGSPP